MYFIDKQTAWNKIVKGHLYSLSIAAIVSLHWSA